jgi:hypothetical protein
MIAFRSETITTDNGATVETGIVTVQGRDFAALGSVVDEARGILIAYVSERPDPSMRDGRRYVLTTWEGVELAPLRLVRTWQQRCYGGRTRLARRGPGRCEATRDAASEPQETTTTMTTANDKIRITMSERRPLSITRADWPIIAHADWHDGQVECQANNVRKIRVREHADGRRIVYGMQEAGDGGQHAGTRNPEGGFLLEAGASEDETVRAIRRVAGIIGDAELADECIATLPTEEV